MPKKDSSWIEKSGLYGTWTFTTETMTDVGYYKGVAYVVMHLMPDPMQVKSCVIKGDSKTKKKACIEANNMACSHAGAIDDENEQCVDIETSQIEWSDVTAFFQFGFILRSGIVTKEYHRVHTSDWVGPYNMIMAPIENPHVDDAEELSKIGKSSNHTDSVSFVSRYVNTPWTDMELQRPFASSAIFNFKSEVLEDVVGTKAINETIHAQKEWLGSSPESVLRNAEEKISFLRQDRKASDATLHKEQNDPYAKHFKTCAHGDLSPILPRLEIKRTRHSHSKHTYSMKLDYSMLSLPVKANDKLYNEWPDMKRHLAPTFPVKGPYCYEKDPNRAYAIRLDYDSAKNSTWKGVKSCVSPYPCWSSEPQPPAVAPSAKIPNDNHSEGSYVLDPMGIEAMIIYVIGLFLVVSLFFNLKLANKLKSIQNNGGDSTSNQLEPAARSTASHRQHDSQISVDNRNPRGFGHAKEAVSDALRELRDAMHEPLLNASSADNHDPLANHSMIANDQAKKQAKQEQGVEESKEEA